MVHITVKRGLNIPVAGEPSGPVKQKMAAKVVGYNFSDLLTTKFRVFVKQGDSVKLGQPLAEDKDVPGRFFVSPGGGVVQEVRRGEKRRLLMISIALAVEEEEILFPLEPLESMQESAIIKRLMDAGLFAHIRMRPFERLAHPNKPPRAIFVKCIESAPFVPPAELQVVEYEREFERGLAVLTKLTKGKVHLVCSEGVHFAPFTNATGVEKHTVSGPHPAGNASLHIHKIDPIRSVNDVVWTVNALDVVAIGTLFSKGKIAREQVVALAGPAIVLQDRGYYRIRKGQMIGALTESRLVPGSVRVIAGDPLTGVKSAPTDVLGLSQTVVSAFPDPTEREFLSFLQLGIDKYSASGAYVSGHMNITKRRWSFTTSQHGEERAFIDGSVYERVMPMKVLPMNIIRAIMGDDWDLAEELGVLEVHPEDFALPEFVCPSKIEMMKIVRDGLRQYCKDTFG